MTFAKSLWNIEDIGSAVQFSQSWQNNKHEKRCTFFGKIISVVKLDRLEQECAQMTKRYNVGNGQYSSPYHDNKVSSDDEEHDAFLKYYLLVDEICTYNDILGTIS